MPELLFRLRGVPVEEADDVRRLLDEHDIDFYETHAGGWGISMPAIWLPDGARLQEAKALIDAYQARRATSAQESYRQLAAEGRQATLLGNIARRPFRSLFLLLALLFVLYLSLAPFFRLAD